MRSPSPADSSPTIPPYIPSGRAGLRAWLIWAGAGLPVSALLGGTLAWAAGHAHGVISWAICTVLAMLAYGVAFGWVADWSHSRQRGLNQAWLLAALLISFGVRWWLAPAFGSLAPWTLFRLGGWDAALWPGIGALLELAVILALSWGMVGQQAANPYSESQHQWARKVWEQELWLGRGEAAQVQEELASRGTAFLLSLRPAADVTISTAAGTWLTLKIQGRSVPQDPQARWIDIDLRMYERSAEGKVKHASMSLLAAGLVSDATFEALHRMPAATPERDTQATPSEEPDTPEELLPAVAALEGGRFEACLEAAKPHVRSSTQSTQADAWRLCALAHSRLAQWTAAGHDFERLFALEPSSHNALQIATTAVMAQDLTRGTHWFERAVEVNTSAQDMPPAKMRTAYLSALSQAGHYDACQEHLEWLAQGYSAMGITDSTFVWMRGFPFFSEFLSKSAELLLHVMPAEQLQQWYEAQLAEVDEAGRAALAAHCAGLAKSPSA